MELRHSWPLGCSDKWPVSNACDAGMGTEAAIKTRATHYHVTLEKFTTDAPLTLANANTESVLR